MPKRIKVTNETTTGRNISFHDNFKNIDLTRAQFVKEIEKGNNVLHLSFLTFQPLSP